MNLFNMSELDLSPTLKKILSIVRLTMPCLLVFSWNISAGVYSQNTKLSLNVENQSIKDIVNLIENQSDFRFIYESGEVDLSKKVTVKVKEQTVEAVLKQLFENVGVNYEVIENNMILINPSTLSMPISSEIAQQKKIVKGVVKDIDGEPIIGANVVEKGTTNGTVTDIQGRFSLETSDRTVLIISYIGYKERQIAIKEQGSIEISLMEDMESIEEVVVVGYGTQRKKDLTGAISNIKTEKLSDQNLRSIQDILRSNAAGLNVGLATDAKAEASFSIRGKGTLSAGSDPLIVLDGVIYEGGLSNITPEDIESIDVLKDASSAAVYGAKAANGVIAITTKKGKKGKPLIKFNVNLALVKVANQPEILDENEFLKYRQDYNEGRFSEEYLAKYPQMFVNPFELDGVNQLDWYNYDQKTPLTKVTDEQLTTQWLSRLNLRSPEIDNYFAGKITKWDDLVFQTGLQQSYTVSVSNATDKTSQYVSLNWIDREGIITGDRFTNFRLRANVESKVTSFLTIGLNLQFSSRNDASLKCDWGQMTMISPYGSNNIDDPDSEYQRRPTGMDPINPFYDNKYTEKKDVYQNLNGKLYAELKLPFGIEYTLNFTPYIHRNDYYVHYSSKGDNWKATGGESTRKHANRFNWQIDNIIHWRRTFAQNHNLDVTLLVNAEKAQFWQTVAQNSGYSPNDGLGYHSLQAGSVPKVSSNDTYQTGDALMGRLYYSYKNKYLITASVRRDGYSAFGKRNPHATFPSVALGWVFTQERFMQQTDSWLNYAKLRFSWGENGNRDIGQYAALSKIESSLRPFIDQSGNFYTSSQMFVSTMSNYNLKWERTASFNLGLDFSLFNNVLNGSIEAYKAKTNDLLVYRALPNITGFGSVTANLGQLQNKGLEITLNASAFDMSDFKWNISGNISMNRRKINSLYGDMVDVLDENGNVVDQKEADDEKNGWFIGQDPDRIWAYERIGIWQLGEEEAAAIYGCQPGDFKYKDQNEDGIMNREDKIFQGYKTPRFRWTLRNEWVYKNFSLSAVLYSYLGYYAGFQRAANNYSFPDRTSDYKLPRWTTSNPINDYARIGSKNIGTNWVNRSFIRLDNVTLSYNVPNVFIQRFAIQNLRFSCGIQNAAVWSPDWSFWDPENGSVAPRTFSLGINVTL